MKDFYSINIGSIWNYLREEKAIFWFICLYLFFEYVRPQSIYTAIDFIPYVQIIIPLTALLYVLDVDRTWTKNIENKFMIIIFIIIILSSFAAYSSEISFNKMSDFYIWFIIYFLIINIVNTEKRFFVFFLSFLIYSFKMSQHGFLSWASIGFGYRDWGVTGAPGWFHNSGEFGIQLSIFIPLSVYFILALRKYWSKLKLFIFLLFPFTGMASIVATTSRGALMGISAVFLWMLLKSKYRIKGVMILLVLFSVVYSILPEELMARFTTAGDDHTSQNRLTRWHDGVDMMNNNPLLGIGYGNWDSYYYHIYGEQGLSHNIFIQAGSELGYTGLIIFILMIIYSFVNNYRSRKLALLVKNNYIYNISHGLDAATIGYIVSGSFVTVMYYPFFWINLAFIVALNNIAKKEFEGIKKKRESLNSMISSSQSEKDLSR